MCACVLDHTASHPDLSLVSFLMSKFYAVCLPCKHTGLMGPNRVHPALISVLLLNPWQTQLQQQESDHGGLHSIDLAAVRAIEKKADISWERLSEHRECR